MKTQYFLATIAGYYFLALASIAIPCSAQELSKSLIEGPLEALVESAIEDLEKDADVKTNLAKLPQWLLKKEPDFSKFMIEATVESLVEKVTLSEPSELDTFTKDDNPDCEPGLVSWHVDFEAACAASGNSGKPVMLFQLLGRLDQRFT